MFGLADDTGKTAVAYDSYETSHRTGAVLSQFQKLRSRILRTQHAPV